MYASYSFAAFQCSHSYALVSMAQWLIYRYVYRVIRNQHYVVIIVHIHLQNINQRFRLNGYKNYMVASMYSLEPLVPLSKKMYPLES